jgi:hypothetical protein
MPDHDHLLAWTRAWLRANERSEAYLARQLGVDRTVLHRVLMGATGYTPAPGRRAILVLMQRLAQFRAQHEETPSHA